MKRRGEVVRPEVHANTAVLQYRLLQ
eukprot:SAG31_NODE_40496_length_280_cov_1.016575_1_plen_25_part_01